jgi:hypothetical protein
VTVSLVCITNDVRDLRSCVVTGQHTDFCDGDEWRWREDSSLSLLEQDPNFPRWRLSRVERSVWDEALKRYVKVPVPCRGCLPRKAEHGLLCWSCWEKVLDAVKVATDMMTHLRSVDRAQQIDNAGIRTAAAWKLPLPNTWLMADEMLMLLGYGDGEGFPSDANVFEVEAITERFVDDIVPETWTASKDGAEAAVRFYLLMQTAMAQHPMKEYEHRVRNVRCYKCRQLTLLWKPPLLFEDQVTVVCTNPKCGAVLDQTLYEHVALIEDPKSAWAKQKAIAPAEEAAL